MLMLSWVWGPSSRWMLFWQLPQTGLQNDRSNCHSRIQSGTRKSIHPTFLLVKFTKKMLGQVDFISRGKYFLRILNSLSNIFCYSLEDSVFTHSFYVNICLTYYGLYSRSLRLYYSMDQKWIDTLVARHLVENSFSKTQSASYRESKFQRQLL